MSNVCPTLGSMSLYRIMSPFLNFFFDHLMLMDNLHLHVNRQMAELYVFLQFAKISDGCSSILLQRPFPAHSSFSVFHSVVTQSHY